MAAGFKESGPAGAELERQVLEQARHSQLRLIGPNCCGANAGYASMPGMRSNPSMHVLAPTATQPALIAQLQAELATMRVERDQLRGALADLLAEQVQLRAQLTHTQAQLAALDSERHELYQNLVDLKHKSFLPRCRSDDLVPPNPVGGRRGMPAVDAPARHKLTTPKPEAASRHPHR